MYSFRDAEDGEVLYVVENRRDGSGNRLGPKPAHLAKLPYDLKQIQIPVEPRLEATADVSNNPITGP